MDATEACRRWFGFARKYLVLTAYPSGEVAVLDAEADVVYQVDFEGGDKMLQAGVLLPA